MKPVLLSTAFFILLVSCTNSPSNEPQPMCDINCNADSLQFSGDHPLHPTVTLFLNGCRADTITWSHDRMEIDRKFSLLNRNAYINTNYIKSFFKDTSYAWLSFNDCITGRGYLLLLPYNKQEQLTEITSALNSFSPKFIVDDNMRAYADYGTLYVVNITNNSKDFMTFKEKYDIDWNDIHKTIDSVNITPNRIFVQLLKNGQKVPLEKNINL